MTVSSFVLEDHLFVSSEYALHFILLSSAK